MPAPEIKICGVSSPDALDAAIAAQADYVGFNFYPPSPRYASPAIVAKLGERAAGRITKVGVFVDADDVFLGEHSEAAKLDAIQLHGAESVERVTQIKSRFGLPVWKVISVSSASDVEKAKAYQGAADLILFDAKTPKGALPGGMGLVFDWSLLARYRGALPWGLAGGLSPANVAEAMAATGASLVDAASGVESAPGVKDVDLIAAFCKAARS
ncbi:phosphoribosylanthranilate isomerase [Altererythrobacter sp. MF3-039]|uniref:phosphoribosylanthranilate isomerase n=1 Tax=Altererythrobacter sp. MF3-039 TaxID=3252901 RepID=UPI00390C90A2